MVVAVMIGFRTLDYLILRVIAILVVFLSKSVKNMEYGFIAAYPTCDVFMS